MNKLTLLFGVLLCLIMVNARHYGDRDNGESLENEEDTLRRPREHNFESRHRKRRYDSSYRYDYPPPGYWYPERRDYERNDQQILQQINKLLEEISAYIRRPPPPPPPPQPIYIPYPVPYYPQIQQVPCNPPTTNDKGVNVNVTKRISEKDMDPNRIWGIVVPKEADYEDGGDGSRPISFDPIVPKQFMKRPSPNVEHGSVQAAISNDGPRRSSKCNAAILQCCNANNSKEEQKQCFDENNCSEVYYIGSGCSRVSIQDAINSFISAYSPEK